MELTLDEALQRGVGAHKAGQIQEAERLYTTILKGQPQHPDANHNMGILAVGVGKIQKALPFFKTALEANPNISQFWISYIDTLIKLDRIADAQSVFDQAKDKGANGEAFDRLEEWLSDKRVNEAKPKEPSSGQLQPIIDLYTQGHLQSALSYATEMLERFPDSVGLYNIAGASNAGLKQFDAAIDSYKLAIRINPNQAVTYNNLGVALNNKGDFDAAISSYKQALEIKPDYAESYNNMGIAQNANGDLDAAISSYKRAIKIKLDYAVAYYNMGNALKDKGDLESAINNYQQAIKIKLDYAEAYNNMGLALNEKGNPQAAIDSYKQAINIKSDYAEAYNNMGVTLNEEGNPEAAIDRYKQAINIKSDYAEAKLNLVTLLTSYTPKNEDSNVITAVNKAIRKIDIKDNTSSTISDDQVVKLFYTSSSHIDSDGLGLRSDLSQTYRRNTVDLNCKRHFSIFKDHDIIPEFCFGCYKVQVEPRSIIELIKLYFVFDQLELNENNTRKCMVELRPEIAGFYKGLIYCSGLKQANQIAGYLDTVVKKTIGSGLLSKVKRGCSEYSISFPDYKEINNSGHQLMNYNQHWKVVEEDYDRKKPIEAKDNISPSLSGLNLNDVLIIGKWIAYARGIGDSSADLINQNTVYDQDMYDQAKARLDIFPFSQ